MLSCFYWIVIDNETVITSDVLDASLDLCGNINYISDFSPMSPLTKAFFSIIIGALILCRNGHKNMVLHVTPSLRERETVTGFAFTTKVFL